MMKIKEVADMTGKSEQTIRNWLRKGKITGTKEDGKWQVDESSVRKYATEKRRKDKANEGVTETVKQGIEEIKEIVKGMKREERESQQLEALAKENAQLKQQVAELQAKMAKLEALEKQVAELMQQQEAPQQQCRQKSEPEPQPAIKTSNEAKRYSRGVEDEEKAEKWARNNLADWLDMPSGLELAKNETWRALAMNLSKKITIRGKQQKSRVYLHIIAKNQKVYGWHKIKAKVALDVLVPEQYNDYCDPVEIGA